MSDNNDRANRPGVALVFETMAWLALAVGMWVYSFQFEADLEAYRFGPVSWPRVVLASIIVLAIVQLVMSRLVARRNAQAIEPTTQPVNEKGIAAWWRIAATFSVPLIYLALLPYTGYFVTTPLFLIAYMLVFRERSAKYIALTTVGLYVASLLVFSKALFVPLPTGNAAGFYDFSNWLLEWISAL